MTVEIRKVVTHVEEVRREGGVDVSPVRYIAAAAVIRNPWAGQGYVADLRPAIIEHAPVLGNLLVDHLLSLAGGADNIEGYGKATLCGTNCEIQHASAMIHTLHFGNIFRKAVGGTVYLAFTNLRGAPGAAIALPMMDKKDEGRRSHYQTMQFSIGDAPFPDEIVVALGVSTGGHPNHRIGDRYVDIAELGQL